MKKSIKCLIALAAAALLIGLDQFTKYMVDTGLGLHNSIPLLPNVFELLYIRNTGTAWGLLAGKRTFFLVITIILLCVMVAVFLRYVDNPRFKALSVTLVFLFAGAIGNMIDRLRFGYVIDFLYIRLIDFPVFNIADCYVTVGMAALFILICFVYKDEDFQRKKDKTLE